MAHGIAEYVGAATLQPLTLLALLDEAAAATDSGNAPFLASYGFISVCDAYQLYRFLTLSTLTLSDVYCLYTTTKRRREG